MILTSQLYEAECVSTALTHTDICCLICLSEREHPAVEALIVTLSLLQEEDPAGEKDLIWRPQPVCEM